jgi:ATP synthase protein I
MFRVVRVQLAVALLVALAAAAFGGRYAALSALAAGLACALPNGLFALNLALLGRWRPGPGNSTGTTESPSALPILAGEVFKLVLTISLLALLAWGYRQVVWPALIVSVGAVLLVQPIALAWPPSGRRARQ